MALHGSTVDALLSWVNSLKVDEPVVQLSQLQDLSVVIKITTKLNGNVDEVAPVLQQPLDDRLNYLCNFLQRHCPYGLSSEKLVQWQKILHGENVEVEIAKIIVLLFYYSNMRSKNPKECEDLDHKTQTELAAILRFLLENEDDLSLNDKLVHFLQRKGRFSSSSDCASSSDDSMSPNLPIKRRTEVRFLELHRVASSSTMKSLSDSPSSPMIEVLHMPQFQMRRLKKQLLEERQFRDELELELSENKKRLAEKEAQLFLMQQRIDRLNEKQTGAHEPRELEELREKNESLMIRLRDTLKQCQDMKTNKNLLERKNDQLAEENGDLAFKVRELSSRLAQLQDALNEMTEEHELSLSGWRQRQSQLEGDLNAAISEKKYLEEHHLILQGKISILEDQLKKMGESSSLDKGERMGDVLKLESLQQEVVALTAKSASLETLTKDLEKEKAVVTSELESQKSRFESEKMQLQDIVTNLQTSLSEITFQKERQDQEAKAQEEKLTCQITTLKLEISKLKTSLTQKEEELLGLQTEVEEEKRQRGQLVENMKKQEEISKQSIEGLCHQVDQLSSALRQSEDKTVELSQKLECEVLQTARLTQECNKFVEETDSNLTVFNQYKSAKEEELSTLNQALHALEKNQQASLAGAEELKREKAELSAKVQELDATILDLIAKCQNLDSENETQSKAHASAVESLKSQLDEQKCQLGVYEQRMATTESTMEENARLKEQLLSTEDMVKNLRERLEEVNVKHVGYVEGQGNVVSKLEGDLKRISESRDQALREHKEEKAASKRLESRLNDLEEEHRARNDSLQVKQKELVTEANTWRSKYEEAQRGFVQNSRQMEEEIERLRRQTLERETAKASEVAAKAREEMSAHLESMSKLEGELSKARSINQEKEEEEQKLRNAVQSLEEKLTLHLQEKERLSQLEESFSKASQELQSLSKALAEEKLAKAELEDELKKLEEQKSERVSLLESDMSNAQAALRHGETEARKLLEEVTMLKNQLKESNVKHREEATQKSRVIEQLEEEKGQALADLVATKTSKTEVEVQLQKSVDTHKKEFGSLQNQLSRSLDLITQKESELERLAKDATSRDDQLRLEHQKVAKLTEELTALKALEERSSSLEKEIADYTQNAKAMGAEITDLKAAVHEKAKAVQSLEQVLKNKEKDHATFLEQHQSTLGEVKVLQSTMAELAKKCSAQDQEIVLVRKEAADAKAAASEKVSALEEQKEGMEDLQARIQQEQQKTREMVQQLEDARQSQADKESSLEALKKELYHKVQELEQSQKTLTEMEREKSTARSKTQEVERHLAKAREHSAKYQLEVEKKTELVVMMEAEVKSLVSKLHSSNKSCEEVRELLGSEQRKNTVLEGHLGKLQADLDVSSKQFVEKEGAMENLRTEVASYREELEKQRGSLEELQKKSSSQNRLTEALEQEVHSRKEACAQKEEQMSHLQQQLSSSQHALAELAALTNTHKELKAERASMDKKYKEELRVHQKNSEHLEAELARSKGEITELLALKDTVSRQEKTLQLLQAENAGYAAQVAELQQVKSQLIGENKALSQASDQGAKNLETELSKIKEQSSQELQALRVQYEKAAAEGKEQLQELSQKLEAVTSKYDHAKSLVMEDRQKFQEERQKLLHKVEELEIAKKEQSEQVQKLSEQLSQQEKTLKAHQQKLKMKDGEISEEVEKKQKRVTELESLLEQQTQAAEHYKTQVEKAKVHYDAKKAQNQELNNKLEEASREHEHLRKEKIDLKMESERLSKELQHSLLHSKEMEQNCKNLTKQVKSLEAQVEYADRQLRELGKFQIATDALKSRETMGPPRETRSRKADVSIDSLDLSHEEDPMNSTGNNGRSNQETASSDSPESLASGRLPGKVESLESLYFTPIPNRVQSKMDSSIGSIGDLSLDSSKKTRSGRRRTTQVINITMTKRTKEEPELESANTSFYSLRSALSHQSLHQEKPRRGGRPQPAVSAPALSSLPSQESLVRSELTSSDDSFNNSVLMNLPGYRPTTRSSARLSQGGRSSFYVTTCQDEPDPQDDWNRIAELQLRNRACPPHLKTSYPLESRPSHSASITDEDVKMGDPKETLRRASILPSQIHESTTSTRRMTLAPSGIDHSWGGNVSTRQQRKRVSEESHQGGDTPESKKSTSCFPRPMTPKDKHDPRKLSVAESKSNVSQQQTQSSRRQSMTFNILNTPKKFGSSLLRRGASRKTETPKNSPRTRGASSGNTSSTSSKSPLHAIRKTPNRRSPRVSKTKSPKTSSKFFERKQPKKK